MKIIQQLKRQVIGSIKTRIAPHLWRSQYEGTMVFVFPQTTRSETRNMGRVFNEDLTCLQGFYSDGTIDAHGGGCMCTPFEAYCLEDLLKIEKWLARNLARELLRREQLRKDINR